LKEHGLIIDHSLATLSLHVSKLTGFSQQNLRANDGFSIVNDIMNDSPAGKLPRFDKIKNFNLTVLRRALVEIIADIDSQMKKNLEDPT
jgi:DNA polymerase III delta subunit